MWPTCFRALRALVAHVPRALRTLVYHHMPRSLRTLVLRVPCALRASCHMRSRVSRVLRALVPYVSCVLRVLGLLVPQTL